MLRVESGELLDFFREVLELLASVGQFARDRVERDGASCVEHLRKVPEDQSLAGRVELKERGH